MIKKDFKILIAGGGTGGHLFSGIAVANEVKNRFSQAQVLFVGTPYGLEKKIVPEQGYQIQFIEVGRFKGSGTLLRLKTLAKLPKAYWQSKKILKSFNPDLVLGIGGYASGPMVLAAHRAKIFTAIIEQNAFPGLTNRKLGKYVDRVFIAFEKARGFFEPKKVILSGNPVRPLSDPAIKMEKKRFTVFILGGSQGAHSINESVMAALPSLKEYISRLHFIHQTGKQDEAMVQQVYQQLGFSAEVFSFRANIGPCYAHADLAICRAGAGTVTELKLRGLPAILIPYPYAADDHQYHNALELVEHGAAELVLNQDLTGDFLVKKILHYLEDHSALKQMSQKAMALAKPDAAKVVLEHCLLGLAPDRDRKPSKS